MFYFWHFWDQNHWQIIPLLEWIYCVFICLDDDYFLLHIPWGLSVLVRFCYCGCKSCTVSDSDCSTIVSHDHVNWNTEDECLHRLTPVTHFLWFLLVSLASCIWKQTHLSNLIHAYIYKYIKLNESVCFLCLCIWECNVRKLTEEENKKAYCDFISCNFDFILRILI